MSADPRSRTQRRRDTEHRLAHDIDVWVASASGDGAPYLVPLSFDWDGEALLMATPTDSPTGRNLAATRTVRLGLGLTRDVSMIEGEVEVLEIDPLPQQRGDRFVDVLPEAGQIEPGEADGGREGRHAQQMET